MRKIIFFTLTAILNISYSQEYNQEEKNDTITYRNELIISKLDHHDRKTEQIILNENKAGQWKIENRIYKHDTLINSAVKFLDTVNHQDKLLWLKILKTKAHYLSNWEDIKYKLNKDHIVEIENDIYLFKGGPIIYGGSFELEIWTKKDKMHNKIKYVSPDEYLNQYPEVDELVSFVYILKLFRQEFNFLTP